MKLKDKQGFFDREAKLDLNGTMVHYRRVLPAKAKTWLALDLAESGLVFDSESGVVYEGYNAGMIADIFYVKYYTDLDLSPYEGEDGWYTLHDTLTSHGFLVSLKGEIEGDLLEVRAVYNRIKDAAAKTFERKHSLEYRIAKSFGFLLTDGDLTESLAKAEGVNSAMIDLLDSIQRQNQSTHVLDDNLLHFAKRKPRGN